jgi:hypothetical protein
MVGAIREPLGTHGLMKCYFNKVRRVEVKVIRIRGRGRDG